MHEPGRGVVAVDPLQQVVQGLIILFAMFIDAQRVHFRAPVAEEDGSDAGAAAPAPTGGVAKS